MCIRKRLFFGWRNASIEPSSGLRPVYIATATSKTKTIGRIDCVGISDALSAPSTDPKSAGSAIVVKKIASVLTLLRYVSADAVVPNTDATLFVPRTSTVLA